MLEAKSVRENNRGFASDESCKRLLSFYDSDKRHHHYSEVDRY